MVVTVIIAKSLICKTPANKNYKNCNRTILK
jgi:hypothetical protein